MHTVELLEQSLELAKQLGYVIRQEWLGGMGGGGCELKGRKVFFFDLSLDTQEQLDLMLETLRHEPRLAELVVSPELQALLDSRKVA